MHYDIKELHQLRYHLSKYNTRLN